jgi:hypothetical protein
VRVERAAQRAPEGRAARVEAPALDKRARRSTLVALAAREAMPDRPMLHAKRVDRPIARRRAS